MYIIKNVLIYRHPSALVAWEHALPTDNGRISVYHAADLSTLPLRPTCFPRYFLHLGYDWSLCLAPSLLPYGVTSMSFRPGCHRPFHRSESVSARCLCCLRIAYSLRLVLFLCFCYPTTLCFSISSLQPSSLFDPSPCIYTAGAYCF